MAPRHCEAAARFAGRGPSLPLWRAAWNAQVTDSGQSAGRIFVARMTVMRVRRSVAEAAHSSSVARPAQTARRTPYSQRTAVACIRVFVQLLYRPNALTLSCKDRPPCRPPGSGAAAAATNNEVAGANCSRRDARVQFGAAQGGSAAEPGLGGFCQLVRVVSRLVEFLSGMRSRNEATQRFC